MCTCDAAGHYQFNYRDQRDQLVEIYHRLGQWIDKNPNKTQDVEQLRILLGPEGLFSQLSWPLQVLGGIQINLSIAHPAGCWFSTVDDLFQFHQALWREDGALHSYAKKIVELPEAKEFGYGYGICVGPHGELGHTGGAPGISTQAFTYPNQGITLIILGNDDSPQKSQLQRELEHFFIRGPVNYLNSNIASEKKLFEDIMAIHRSKNPDRSLRMG